MKALCCGHPGATVETPVPAVALACVDEIERSGTIMRVGEGLLELRLQNSATSLLVHPKPFAHGGSANLHGAVSSAHGPVAVKSVRVVNPSLLAPASPLLDSLQKTQPEKCVRQEARLLHTFAPSLSLRLVQQADAALIVMPAYHLSAKDLAWHFTKNRSTSPHLAEWCAIDMLADVLPTLATMHASHCVHRDIKPDNIMRGHRFELIDYGLAEEEGRIEGPSGTVGYLSPQELRLWTAGYAGPRPKADDVWSLGVSALVMVVGVHAADGLLIEDPHDTPPQCNVARLRLDGTKLGKQPEYMQDATKALEHLPAWFAEAVLPSQFLAGARRPSAAAWSRQMQHLRDSMPAEQRNALDDLYATHHPTLDAFQERLASLERRRQRLRQASSEA